MELEIIVSTENSNCEGDFTYSLKEDIKESIKKQGEESKLNRVGISFVNKKEYTEYSFYFNFNRERKELIARGTYKISSFSGTINLSRLIGKILEHTRKVFADIGGV